ncbi:MAG: hypothetical protein GOV00_04380 [Candidatus Altiarchaeota archaeon]|nr:hypothetical protein [Candidatus Altiarchaeota archaeon]
MIVGMGGGKGLSQTILALKQQGFDFGAVVETTDNGGSTGKLRDLFDVPAMGDIRRVVNTVSDSPFTDAMEYRFEEHAVGNLVLLNLMNLHGFSKAMQIYRKAMGLKQPIEPLFNRACDLVAEFEHEKIFGEVQIDDTEGKLLKLSLSPNLPANLHAIELIEAADAVVVGPGSLFTSVMPHFLVKEVRNAVSKVPLKIYVMNITNDVAPVKGFKASDYLRTLKELGGFVPDKVLVQKPSMGIEIDIDGVCSDLSQTEHLHCPKKLGEVLCQLLR